MDDSVDRMVSTKIRVLYDRVKNNFGGVFDLYYHLEVMEITVEELMERSKDIGLDQLRLDNKASVTLVGIGISFNNYDITMGIGELIIDKTGMDNDTIIDLVLPMNVCKVGHLDDYIKILDVLGIKSDIMGKLTPENLEETLDEYRNFKFNNIDEM